MSNVHEKQKQYRQRPEVKQARRVKKLISYGLSHEEALVQLSKTICDGCLLPFSSGEIAHIDHDHDSGKFRGMVHLGCNVVLGHVGDEAIRLFRLAAYRLRHLKAGEDDLFRDSGDRFLNFLEQIVTEDAAGLRVAYDSYGPSWKQRGGANAFFMLCRKWDRLENRLKKSEINYDIFRGIATDTRGEGVIDDVRDLRRYLLLVEAEMRARGFGRTHRDNE